MSRTINDLGEWLKKLTDLQLLDVLMEDCAMAEDGASYTLAEEHDLDEDYSNTLILDTIKREILIRMAKNA